MLGLHREVADPLRLSRRQYDESARSYIGARYYDAQLGRFINRDPIGYRGGWNAYGYASNTPINAIDPSGQYPEMPGHGHMISPRDSVALVSRIVSAADNALDLEVRNSYRKRTTSAYRNANRMVHLSTNIGSGTFNRFVFTCKWGWIDHGHFWNNALVNYLERGALFYVGYARIFSDVTEMGQYISDQTGIGSGSGWSPEDLISNDLGRQMGKKAYSTDAAMLTPALWGIFQYATPYPSNRFLPLHVEWHSSLKTWGAVKWNTGVKINGLTVQELLRGDAANFRMADIQPTARSINEGRAYLRSTAAWRCLCSGTVPKLPIHRF